MNIIIYNDLVLGGGVEVVMYDLVEHLINNGHKVKIITENYNTAKSDFKNTYKKFGNKCSFIPYNFGLKFGKKRTPFKVFFRLLWKIYLFLNAAFVQDVFIAIKESFHLELAKFPWKKKLLWVHSDYNYFSISESEKPLLPKIYSSFNKVVCVSEAVKQSVIKKIGDTKNLIVKYNPINVNKILNLSCQETEITKPKNKILFVSVGRLCSEKNYSELIKAVSKIENKNSFELWIIGDGPEKDSVEQIINETNCFNVRLLGNQENPFKYLKMADCFISSSLTESYGLAIKEALILGIPVITTNIPAVLEYFSENYGLIVEPNETDFKNAIEYIINNPEKLIEYKNNLENVYSSDSLWNNRLNEIYKIITE